MPDRLRLITPGGIPAPPEAAAQLLADFGVPSDDLRYRMRSSMTVVERGSPDGAPAEAGPGHTRWQNTPRAAVQEPLRAGERALNPSRGRGPHAPVTPLQALPPSPADDSAGRASAGAGALAAAYNQPRTPSRLGQNDDPVLLLAARVPEDPLSPMAVPGPHRAHRAQHAPLRTAS